MSVYLLSYLLTISD